MLLNKNLLLKAFDLQFEEGDDEIHFNFLLAHFRYDRRCISPIRRD
jgi:hypothetical protein